MNANELRRRTISFTCSKPEDHPRVLALNAYMVAAVVWSGLFWGGIGALIYWSIR